MLAVIRKLKCQKQVFVALIVVITINSILYRRRQPAVLQIQKDKKIPTGLPWNFTVHSSPLRGKSREVVALAMGITSRRMKFQSENNVTYKDISQFAIMKLVTSFCKHSSVGYDYAFYMSFDFNDKFFANNISLLCFSQVFLDTINNNCQQLQPLPSLHLLKCAYSGKPAWAQNDAAMQAYLEGSDYILRLNDDIVFETSNWTQHLVDAIQAMTPRYVGVVGPLVGRSDIFIVDFVHKTHVDIFGFYYPRELPDWYCDNWITNVYEGKHRKRVTAVRLGHSQRFGTRYKPTTKFGNETGEDYLTLLVRRDNVTLQRFIAQIQENDDTLNMSQRQENVLIFTFDKQDSTAVHMLIRNVQISRVFFKLWQTKVYFIGNDITEYYNEYSNLNLSKVLEQLEIIGFYQHVINRLMDLGAAVHFTRDINKEVETEQATFVAVWSRHTTLTNEDITVLKSFENSVTHGKIVYS